jgi:hypothetical protein
MWYMRLNSEWFKKKLYKDCKQIIQYYAVHYPMYN